MPRLPPNLEAQIRRSWQEPEYLEKEPPIFGTLGCIISHRCYYRYNINHPEIQRLFKAYCKKYNITILPCRRDERLRFESDMDKFLFPNGLPEKELRRREIIESLVDTMDDYLKWREEEIEHGTGQK